MIIILISSFRLPSLEHVQRLNSYLNCLNGNNHLFFRVTVAVKQFQQGLHTLGLLDLIESNPFDFAPLFIRQKQQVLTANIFAEQCVLGGSVCQTRVVDTAFEAFTGVLAKAEGRNTKDSIPRSPSCYSLCIIRFILSCS